MKTPQKVLAAAIEEAIELFTLGGFDGTLALRRLSEVGYEIRPRIGDVRVAASDMSDSLMLPQAAALGFDIVYADEVLDRMGFVGSGAPEPAEQPGLRSWGDVIGEAITTVEEA